MRKIASLAILIAFAGVALADEVKVKFTRPSTLITYFSEFQSERASPFAGKTLTLAGNPSVVLGRLEGTEGGMVPKGVTLIAHDSKGILEISGPTEGVTAVKNYVKLFDVAPVRVSLGIEMSCPTLNTETQTKTTLVNNKKWSTEDELLRLGMTIATRVNADNTITMDVEIRRANTTKQSMVFRVRQGEAVKFYVNDVVAFAVGDGKPTKIESKERSEGDIDEPEVVLTLRADILTAGLQSNSKPAG